MKVDEKNRVTTAAGLQMPTMAPNTTWPWKKNNYQTIDQARNDFKGMHAEQKIINGVWYPPTLEKEWSRFQLFSQTGSSHQLFQEDSQLHLL